MAALGLGPNQAFLFDGYDRVLNRIGPEGAGRLLHLVNQTDLDLKGLAISRSATPMLNLTTALCRAWGQLSGSCPKKRVVNLLVSDLHLGAPQTGEP